MEMYFIRKRSLSSLQFLVLFLVVHLPLVVEVTCSLALLQLGLVGPDHQEEIGAKHPGENVAYGRTEAEAGHCHEDATNLQDKADSRHNDPGCHQTHVALKQKAYVNFKLFKQTLYVVDTNTRGSWGENHFLVDLLQ